MTVYSLGQSRYMQGMVNSLSQRLQVLDQQIASGKKAQTFGDHGAADTRRLISLREDVSRREQYRHTISIVDTRASQTEIIMKRLQVSVTSVRDTAIRVGTDGMEPSMIQQQALDAFDEMYQVLSTDMSGYFLFSGIESDTPPLLPLDTLKTNLTAQIAADLAAAPLPPLPAAQVPDPQVALASAQAFFADPTNFMNPSLLASSYEQPDVLDPTTWSLKTTEVHIADGRKVSYPVQADEAAFKDIFAGLAATAFTNDATVIDPTDKATRAAYDRFVADAAEVMTNGLDKMRSLVTANGVVMQSLDEQDAHHQDVTLLMETQLLKIEQVDMYEASAQIKQLQLQLEATYNLTARLSQLSLIHYLR